MSVNRSADMANAVGDYEVKLVRDAATTVGLNRAGTKAWPTTFEYADCGGPTDHWGTTWTPADVNATGSGNLPLDARGTALGECLDLLQRHHGGVARRGGEQRPVGPAEFEGFLG
jgi:hypothetical protein